LHIALFISIEQSREGLAALEGYWYFHGDTPSSHGVWDAAGEEFI
jgi:hypothetical protein